MALRSSSRAQPAAARQSTSIAPTRTTTAIQARICAPPARCVTTTLLAESTTSRLTSRLAIRRSARWTGKARPYQRQQRVQQSTRCHRRSERQDSGFASRVGRHWAGPQRSGHAALAIFARGRRSDPSSLTSRYDITKMEAETSYKGVPRLAHGPGEDVGLPSHTRGRDRGFECCGSTGRAGRTPPSERSGAGSSPSGRQGPAW